MQPAYDHFVIDQPNITAVFFFQGDSLSEVQPFSKQQFRGNTHNIRYLPRLRARFRMPAQKQLNYFLIILSPDYYFRLLGQSHANFAAAIRQNQPAYATPTDLPITPEMRWLINEIRQCTRTGAIKRLLLEARIMALLTLQTEQMQQLPLPSQNALPADDQEKLDFAKEYLEANFTTPPTLKDLARLSGLNEFKLKKGFREHFGTSVHAYSIRLRLEAARRLLLETTQSIGEIGLQVGYKSGAQFSAAFKVQYGMPPSTLRE